MPSTELAIQKPLVKASTELSQFLGMEVPAMLDTIKAQCFKGRRPDEVTDAQLATYISVANALHLNPLLPGQMYPYPDRNGSVTVMIGPDGVFTLLSNHPDVVAQKDGGAAFWTEHGTDPNGKETCTGYINHKSKGLLKKTIWVDEWVVSSNPNWQSRRHHMAEIRALKQVARMIIHGLPVDSDEHKLGEMLNVTDSVPVETVTEKPTDATPPQRPAPPTRAKKGAAAVAENPKPVEPPVTVEATVLPPKTETPAPAKELALETDEAKAHRIAQEMKDDKPETPAPVTSAPKMKGRPDHAHPATTIKDGEKLSVTCTVGKVFALFITFDGSRQPSVQANVTGDFEGTVYQHGGASVGDDGLVAGAPWKEGAVLDLELVGKKLTKMNSVIPVVEKATEAAGEELA